MQCMNALELRHLLEGLRGEERFARVYYKTEKSEILPVEMVKFLRDPEGQRNMLLLQIIPEEVKSASIP